MNENDGKPKKQKPEEKSSEKKPDEQGTAATPQPEVANRAVEPKMVIVRVGKQPINEGGHRAAGSEFECEESRAKGLKQYVSIVG